MQYTRYTSDCDFNLNGFITEPELPVRYGTELLLSLLCELRLPGAAVSAICNEHGSLTPLAAPTCDKALLLGNW